MLKEWQQNHGDKLCGAITASINYYCIPEEIKLVTPDCFLPSPSVDSEVIKLTICKEPPVKVINKKTFFYIIKIAFSQRRKTFLNVLINNKICNKDEAIKMLQFLNIDANRRGETFTLEEFAKIENYISKNK